MGECLAETLAVIETVGPDPLRTQGLRFSGEESSACVCVSVPFPKP